MLQPFPVHIGSDPLLALRRLHLSFLIDSLASALSTPPASLAEQHATDEQVDEACRVAARCVAGVSSVLPEGHPVRGIALAELGKLLCVDVDPSPQPTTSSSSGGSRGLLKARSPGSPLEQASALPRGVARLQVAAQVLYRAREELLVGFGRAYDGGQVGQAVQTMLRDLEREATAWRKATAAGSQMGGVVDRIISS